MVTSYCSKRYVDVAFVMISRRKRTDDITNRNCMPTGAVHFLRDHVKPCHGYVADKRGPKGKGKRQNSHQKRLRREDGFLLHKASCSIQLPLISYVCVLSLINGVGRYSCRTALLFVVASILAGIVLLVLTTRTRTRRSVVVSIRS